MRQEWYALTFLRVLGVTMALATWAAVIFPGIRVSWKGGNRAPLSMRSKVVCAFCATSWCFAVFGVYPGVAASIFASCVVFGLFQADRDRAAYDQTRGVVSVARPALTPRQMWIVLCTADALVLVLSLYAAIRDWRFPPVTEEQHIAHAMGLVLLAASLAGALILPFQRRRG
jgi:hypothetical protein